MKKSLMLLCLFSLCLGQNCIQTTVEPVTAIPQGSYSGDVTTTLQGQSGDAEPTEATSLSQETVVFSAEGLPLVGTNTSVYVGYVADSSLDGIQVTQTITAVEPAENSLVVGFDAAMLLVGTTSSATLTGPGQSSYTLRSDGGLDYSTTMALTGSQAEGDAISVDVVSVGVLTR